MKERDRKKDGKREWKSDGKRREREGKKGEKWRIYKPKKLWMLAM